jgi:multiple sugar transport system permease protein
MRWRPKWRRKLRLADNTLGVILLLPSVLLFVVLLLYPLAYVIYVSFFSKSLLSPQMAFVGLDNYTALLASGEYWNALKNSVIWAGGTVSLQVGLGVAVALLLHQAFSGRAVARGLVLFPYMVPIISVTLTWLLMFTALRYGVVNYLLMEFGLIDAPIAWLVSNPMLTVVLVGVWKYFPFVVIVVLARLQLIPQDLYEAAKIDGASTLALFTDITLPQLRNVLFVVVLLRTIWMFNNFEVVYLLTGGGPLRATMTLPILVYEEAFGSFRMGQGAAVAVTMFLFLLIVLSIYFRLFRRAEESA